MSQQDRPPIGCLFVIGCICAGYLLPIVIIIWPFSESFESAFRSAWLSPTCWILVTIFWVIVWNIATKALKS